MGKPKKNWETLGWTPQNQKNQKTKKTLGKPKKPKKNSQRLLAGPPFPQDFPRIVFFVFFGFPKVFLFFLFF